MSPASITTPPTPLLRTGSRKLSGSSGSQPTRVVPGSSGLHVTLDPGGISGWDTRLAGPAAPAISTYLQAVLGMSAGEDDATTDAEPSSHS
jgi:hypothetical protein